MSQRSLTNFIDSFAYPLVAGKEMRVGAPIDSELFDTYVRELPHATLELSKVDELRERALSLVTPWALNLGFDEDELRLCAALHNIYFLSHPGHDVKAKSREKILRASRSFLLGCDAPSKQNAFQRHGVLRLVLSTYRRDRRLSWWSGSANFYGQDPPQRLLGWSNVRRVSTEEQRATLSDVLEGDDQRKLMMQLMGLSPLSLFGASLPPWFQLNWEDATFVLKDVELSRWVVHKILTRKNLSESLRELGRYAAAMTAFLLRRPESSEVYIVASLLVHCLYQLAIRPAAHPAAPDLDAFVETFSAMQETSPFDHAALLALSNFEKLWARVPAEPAAPARVCEPLELCRTLKALQSGEDATLISTLQSNLSRHGGVVESEANPL